MASYNHSESLVSTQWVAEHLNDAQIRIVEIVWGASPAENKHIPGAIAWDFEDDLQCRVGRDVLEKPELEALLSKSGLIPETTIILYSGLNNLLATYAFWLLKVYGHEDIRLMDGDRQKWLEENRQTTNEVPIIVPTLYQAQEHNWSIHANRNDVLQSIGKENCLLLDARSAEMYNGLDKAGTARGGHVPSAINLVARRETNPDGSFKAWRIPTIQTDGTFKPAEELQAIFDHLGFTRDKEIITYCVRGGLSTHAWFVLTQLLGYPNVREYDRSWAEWGNLEGMPIESTFNSLSDPASPKQ